MLKISFLLCNHMLASSTTLPMELWRAADSLYRSRGGLKGRRKTQLDIQLVSIDAKPIKTHTGLILTPEKSVSELDETHILFIPALWRNPKPIIRENHRLIPWLQRLHSQNTILAGVGTGCWLLAETGLLNQKPATTHWYYFDEFQQEYPKVQLKRAHFITQADNIYCSGSVNAFAELTVHFIGLFYDREISGHVERHFFHEIRTAHEGIRAFKDTHPDEDIVQAQQWLHDHYAEPIKISDLCKELDMSVRTFNRRFKEASNQTPMEYLHKIRMEFARDLLKTTNLSIGEIVFRVGYHDAAHFTALFKKAHGTTPRQYRVTVRGKLFSLQN